MTSAHVGQSFCTGRRRTGRFAGCPGSLACDTSSPAIAPTAWLSCTVIGRPSPVASGRLAHGFGCYWAHMEQLQAALLYREEFGRERAGADAGTWQLDRDRLDDAARPRAHHVHLVGEIDR